MPRGYQQQKDYPVNSHNIKKYKFIKLINLKQTFEKLISINISMNAQNGAPCIFMGIAKILFPNSLYSKTMVKSLGIPESSVGNFTPTDTPT